MSNYVLIHGDCLEQLKTLPSDSVDSMVTDPPAGIAFMGKEWDEDKGGRKQWVAWMTDVMGEALRVLKPGAHGLVWALPRTSHWTATALEDAGFEVRDVVTHLFGTGFPKSLDISKAMDKTAGAEREIVGKRPWSNAKMEAGHGISGLKQAGSFAGEYSAERVNVPITAPATDAAKQWAGWGTALKPASEHWILVRKPISEKTVAANVLMWGVGGINIDGCRIEGVAPARTEGGVSNSTSALEGGVRTRTAYSTHTQGRFPANLVLSHSEHCIDDQCDIECAIKALDGQSLAGGMHSAGKARIGGAKQTKDGALFGIGNHNGNGTRIGDSGGASRFFYVAKASKTDKGEGNTHPTVKSTALMRYLCRMITPPGGAVLDPFTGSGSTGVAAITEGFLFIGIEKENEYASIAETRIGEAHNNTVTESL